MARPHARAEVVGHEPYLNLQPSLCELWAGEMTCTDMIYYTSEFVKSAQQPLALGLSCFSWLQDVSTKILLAGPALARFAHRQRSLIAF